MGLSDLLAGHAADEAPVGSSHLHGLVRPVPTAAVEPETKRLSLPAALNRRARGEISVEPAGSDEGLSSLMVNAAPLPPAPKPDWRDDPIFVEQRAQNAIDRAEMKHRIAAKRGISLEAAEQWMEQQNV
jgi:hypothetical protein